MSAAVALLRGINVGGRAKVGMADLRTLAEHYGLGNVRTIFASGNLLFTLPERVAHIAAGLEVAIAQKLGVQTRVLLRTRDELQAVVAANPLLRQDRDHASLHVVFLEEEPSPERVAGLDPDRFPPDTFTVSGREIYAHYPNGAGRSKLTLDYFERQLGVAGTARNWNTVTKLLAMLDGG